MATKESHPTDVDIDPGWYPGQPELEDESEGAPKSVPKEAGASISYHVGGSVGVSASLNPVSEPTVLKKLQKWGDYESVGAQVLPTKFIPMKTPLSAEILDSWSLPSQPKHRLTVQEMVAEQATLGRKVGLLLDLSNHDCLYTADIPPGLAYTHVQLVAKELPPPEFVDAVVGVANRFWARHPDEYIAVHCAYGFNRTGFVVCCYLIECCGLSVEDALSAFADSRPPGVKHEQFRLELHRRYSGGGAGYCVVGSPDDNSSFGYSPSCGSLDLRDMCYSAGGGMGGGSPVPGLTRGSTFDCLLAPHHSAAGAGAAAGGCGGGSAAGSSPSGHLYRRSLDGHHQTLTFTSSSSFVRRRSGGGGQNAPAASAATAAARPEVRPLSAEAQQQGQLEGRRAQPDERGDQGLSRGPAHAGAQQGSRGGQGGSQAGSQPQGSQHAAQAGRCAEDGRGQDIGVSGVQQGTATCSERQDVERGAQPDAAEPAADGCSISSGNRAASMQRQPSCNDDESLGVNDRQLLQTLRQQALAQLSATIPEESGSLCSTPARGCSSLSLADTDGTPGHSTPRPAPPGRYSHKSLDTIDWGAAAAADASGDVLGNGAAPPVSALEAKRIG